MAFDPKTAGFVPIYQKAQWTGNGQNGEFSQGEQTGWGRDVGDGTIEQVDMNGSPTFRGPKGDWSQFLKGAGMILAGGLGASMLGLGGAGGAAGGAVSAPVLGSSAAGTDLGLLGAPAAVGGGGAAVGGSSLVGGASSGAAFNSALNAAGAGGGLLNSLKDYAPLIGAGLGALGSSGDTTKTDTSKKEPWGPAQDWMKANLKTGQNLQNYYEQNPFNQLQKTGYQNSFTGLDNFNQNMMPGLMDFANQMMTSRYERQRGGPAGSGAGYGGGVVPGGMRSGGVGPFSAPQMQSYGLLDWNALNPFANGVAGTPKV